MKKQLKLGMAGVALGVTLFIAGLFFREIDILIAMSGVCTGISLVNIIKYLDWWAGSDKTKKKLEEEVDEEIIEKNDERNKMLRGKALDLTVKIMLGIIGVALVVILILGQAGVMPEGITIYILIGMTSLYLISAIVMKIIHNQLRKKY